MNDSGMDRLVAAMAEIAAGRAPAEPPGGTEDLDKLSRALADLGREVSRRLSLAERIARITAEINRGLDLEQILDLVWESFDPVIPFDRLGLALIEDGGTVRARWGRSRVEPILLRAGYTASLTGSSLETIIETGTPRIIENLVTYLEYHPHSRSTRLIVGEGMRSSLTCPLVADAKPIGFLFFSSVRAWAYEQTHVEAYQQIAGQLSVIVEKGRLYQRLTESNRIKDRLLGVVAHDLRTPIGVVMGFASLLADGQFGPVNDQQREVILRISRSCEAMLSLVNDLLDDVAVESGRLELELRPIDLGALMRDARESAAILARAKGVTVELVLPEGLPTVVADPLRIGQVISNLVTNAIKFSPPGAAVSIGVRDEPEKGAVSVAVTDHGPGIPREEVPLLFSEGGKTSVRPTAGEKSTGLGLAIAKRIVQLHGGKIAVHTEVGAGSTFSVWLLYGGPAQGR